MPDLRTLLRFPLLAAVALLAACDDGTLSMQLSADPAGELNVRSVVVTLKGVALQRDDSSEDTITLPDTVKVDLASFTGQSTYQLVDGEGLAKGSYTGVRLLFSDSDSSDDDNYLIDSSGTRRPIRFADENVFAPLAFSVKKNDGKNFEALLRLDLRLSLSPDGSSARLLTPVLRAVRSKNEAVVSGSVSNSKVTASSCRGSRNAGVGVAVYAFAGRDVVADDRDGADAEPLATTAVLSSGSSRWTYTIDTLPAGDYTLALTCQGDSENPRQSDNIEFVESKNVTLKKGDTEESNF